jgi:hypothetical protein
MPKSRHTGSFGRKQVKQAGPCGCKGIGDFAEAGAFRDNRRQKDRALGFT